MPDRPDNLIKILPVLILGVILSGSVVLVGIRQLYLSKAGITGQIARVDTQPAGDIVVSIHGQPVYLSALAYDSNGEPILSGVTYQWGLSSSGSLGTLTTNNEVATFVPGATSGSGDLWVQAFNTLGQGMKSQKIYVGITPPPTPSPLPYIQVLTPNGGEQLTIGQSYTIKWQSSPGIATYLIYLENSLGQMSLINGVNAPNTSYAWKVDSAIMQNTGLHKIKVMDGSQGGVDYQSATQDQSDNFFTIVVPGDANGDSKVDGVDYVIWLGHYGQTSTRWSSVGDFNTDSHIDGIDYIIWLNHYGQ